MRTPRPSPLIAAIHNTLNGVGTQPTTTTTTTTSASTTSKPVTPTSKSVPPAS